MNMNGAWMYSYIILNFGMAGDGWIASRPGRHTPSYGQEIGWAPESVPMLRSTDKSVTLAGNRSPASRPTSLQTVSVPPELPRLTSV
jgi:hypothetical protein